MDGEGIDGSQEEETEEEEEEETGSAYKINEKKVN